MIARENNHKSSEHKLFSGMQSCHITLTLITNQDTLYLCSVFNLLECIHGFNLLHYPASRVKVAFLFRWEMPELV